MIRPKIIGRQMLVLTSAKIGKSIEKEIFVLISGGDRDRWPFFSRCCLEIRT